METWRDILESQKMNETELAYLCCRGKYRISQILTIFDESDQNNELFHIFGGLVSRSTVFMKRWLILFVRTHWNHFETAGKDYLDFKGLTLKAWKQGIKSGMRADCLALHGLCLVCDVHCFVHLKNGEYWSSLQDDPQDHDIYLERCNIHLAYIGRGIFVELEMRLETTEFEIFRVETPVRVETVETKTVVTGELDSNESETLKCLLQTGLNTKHAPLYDTVTVKQDSSQVQQLANEFEFKPEPESTTSQVSSVATGVTTEPRHKPNIQVVTSVHLDDESFINILKELRLM